MMVDWRQAICSPELRHELMLAESLRQFARMLASSVPVLLLLEAQREDPAVAREVIALAEELLAQPLDPGTLSISEVPLACSAYVLSRAGDVDALSVVAVIARRSEREWGWAPEFAALCLATASPTSAGNGYAASPVGLLFLERGGVRGVRFVSGAASVDSVAPEPDARLQAAA